MAALPQEKVNAALAALGEPKASEVLAEVHTFLMLYQSSDEDVDDLKLHYKLRALELLTDGNPSADPDKGDPAWRVWAAFAEDYELRRNSTQVLLNGGLDPEAFK